MVEYVLLLAIFILGVVVAIGSLDESIEGETIETAAEIGGQPPASVAGTTPWADNPTGVSSVAPPPGPSTSTSVPVSIPGLPPIVSAGPDGAITPGVVHTQVGSATDPDGDAFVITWTAQGGGQITGGNGTETIQVSWTRPGTHQVKISAQDTPGHVSTDKAYVTVSSGEITPTGIDESYWQNRDEWVPQVEIDLFNQFGERVALGSTVVVEFTKPDGSTSTASCTVNSNAEVDCADAPVNFSVDWVDAEVIDITGPNVDSWQSFDPGGVIRLTPGPRPNDPPTIEVGGLVTFSPGTPFTMNATASDPENDPLTHDWDVYRAGNNDTSGTSIANGDTLSPAITINQKGQHWIYGSANDGRNPDVWDGTQALVYEGTITAVVTDESYWVDHDTWRPQHAISYFDSDGDEIVFDIENTIDYVGPGGRTVTASCGMEGERFVSNNWDECWNSGWGNDDVNSTPYVDAYTPSVTTPFGVTVSLPGTPIRLVPPTGGRPSPTTRPPAVTTTDPPATTTTRPPATTTTSRPVVTKPPTTTTSTTTTTKKPKKDHPKGF